MALNLVIFVSGQGSNMRAIINAIEKKYLEASISLVFSNNPSSPALSFASEHKIQTHVIDHSGISRQAHELAVLKTLSAYQIDFIVLAGYMRVLSATFLRQFQDPLGFYRVINIHPSLLPAFPGAHPYEDAFNYGVMLSGITIHLVDEKVDHGPILAQEAFPRFAHDTLESFKARGLAVEHQLYPKVLQQIASSGVHFIKRMDDSKKTFLNETEARVL